MVISSLMKFALTVPPAPRDDKAQRTANRAHQLFRIGKNYPSGGENCRNQPIIDALTY
tara:strand:- start:821 stop:994 length:174 start_codon:yes stop_codon:yes gene_type:complete